MTPADDLCFLDIATLADRIRARSVSPVDVVEAYLARIGRLDPTLNAFVTVAADAACAAARAAESEIATGHWRGPLHGVPVGVKDIFDTAGLRTTNGSSFFRDFVPAEDADSVRRLRDAGAIVVGKCNTHEFAAGSTTNNPWYGASRNPWALDRSPGGSSGGSGAAVAAFLCAGATGTDTGGSIRSPAACCGVVGLKPTYGRVSLRGIYPNAPSLDHAGPIARTARDAALLLQAMAGYDALDPTSADVAVPNFTAAIDAGIAGMRISRCPDLHLAELDTSVTRAIDDAIDVLAGLGAKVDTTGFRLASEIPAAQLALMRGEFITLHRERFRAHPEGYGADVRERLAEAESTTLDDYVHGCRTREAIRREFVEIFRRVDAFVLPVTVSEAPLVATGTSVVNGREVSFGAAGVPLRQTVNVCGIPAVAVPIGFGPNGLPLAMQIVGPAWSEATVLRVAHAYEQATPAIRSRRPPNA